MKLTIEHILELIEVLPTGKVFNYVSGGDSKAKLMSVDKQNLRVDIVRVNADGTEKSASMTTDILTTLSNSIKENIPFKFDNVLNGSGNVRSTMEAIFAHTAEFYSCKIKRVKHLIWVPSMPHKVGEIVEYDSIRNDLEAIINQMKPKFEEKYAPYLTAIRTKPFLLLAGISGTGKSRIVRELAFKSCPKYLQDEEGTAPGNYCMIEVKPNWHDSTELLGYYSNLSKGYQFKKFVMFLVKAKMFPQVPFFVCLDEMNLAPVEHYFAEILSILETRKHPKIAGTDEVDMEVIKTGPIVEARHFRELGQMGNAKNVSTGLAYSMNLTDRDIYMKLFGIETENDIDEEVGKKTDLTTIGLTLPDNVIIIGTVNMDDTTHQFSRKVIDRAMTIEMNGGKLSDMYGGSNDLEYLDEAEQKKWQKAFVQRYVTADDVLKEHSEVADKIIEEVPEKLDNINKALKGTPFEVSYRVLNELTIMIGVMLDDPEEDGDIDSIIDKALDRILLMKILPRIEGDADMFNLSSEFKKKNDITHENRLEWLKELAPNIVISEDEPHQQTAREKIQEMIERLGNQEFTRFWP